MSTVPSLSNVAVNPGTTLSCAPVNEKVPIVGSYNSALAVLLLPSATSTLPAFGPVLSKVAVGAERASVMLPVAEKLSVAGSYSCALELAAPPFNPPAKRTFPLVSKVAVVKFRIKCPLSS